MCRPMAASIRGVVDPIEFLHVLVKKHGSQLAAAKVLGVSASYLGDILKGSKPPGPKVLRALRLKRKLVYVHEQ